MTDVKANTGPPGGRRIDRPEVGFYRCRMARKGQWLAARIISRASQPDRSPVKLCFVAGEEVDLTEWWPRLHPVSEADYRRLLDCTPSDPRAAVDLATAEPAF